MTNSDYEAIKSLISSYAVRIIYERKDGVLRTMFCTSNRTLMLLNGLTEKLEQENYEKRVDQKYTAVFDLQLHEFRSIDIMNVKDIIIWEEDSLPATIHVKNTLGEFDMPKEAYIVDNQIPMRNWFTAPEQRQLIRDMLEQTKAGLQVYGNINYFTTIIRAKQFEKEKMSPSQQAEVTQITDALILNDAQADLPGSSEPPKLEPNANPSIQPTELNMFAVDIAQEGGATKPLRKDHPDILLHLKEYL